MDFYNFAMINFLYVLFEGKELEDFEKTD